MKVLLFGATGMIGQGVLRECLADDSITQVLSISRSSTGTVHPKFREFLVADLTTLDQYENELAGYDACLFSAGVTSLGLSEAEYLRITHDVTLAAVNPILRASPLCTIVYVSGAGADSSEQGRVMWARVKGKTENTLIRLSDRTYIFRPSLIIPLDGIRSRTGWYNAVYALLRPITPVVRKLGPALVTTTRQLGRAMIAVGRNGYSKRILEMPDINSL